VKRGKGGGKKNFRLLSSESGGGERRGPEYVEGGEEPKVGKLKRGQGGEEEIVFLGRIIILKVGHNNHLFAICRAKSNHKGKSETRGPGVDGEAQSWNLKGVQVFHSNQSQGSRMREAVP